MNINRKGVKVTDSKRDIKIRITNSDIKHAVCRDHQKCVIARALKRQLGAAWVDVGALTVLVAKTPKRATRFILNELGREQVRFFDTHEGRFAPCKVQLYAPPKSLQLGHRKGDKARSGKAVSRCLKRSKPTR